MTDLRPIRMRARWLWLAGVRAEVELVKPAHRSDCAACGVRPTERRLHLTIGSGRSGHAHVLCADCAQDWVRLVLAEGKRALLVLSGCSGPVRFGSAVSSEMDKIAIRFHQLLRPKKKADDEEG